MKTTAKRKIRKSKGDRIFDFCNVIFMLLVGFVMIFPMWHVLCVSLSEGTESLKGGFFFWPKGGINFSGYTTVFKEPMIIRSYANTVLYAAGSVVFTLFFTALTAYPLANRKFKLKKQVTFFLTFTMFVSGGMIPTFLLIKNLKLINTIWSMIIPGCVSAYNVILFRTFFTGLPQELREAAIIDGASEFTVFTRIYIPLSKAIFATIGLYTLVGKWNDWFSALLYLSEESKYPIQMILRKILFNAEAIQQMNTEMRTMTSAAEVTTQNIKMAAIVITIVPILCIYPFLQKYFVKGVFVGTVKG